MEFSPHTSIGYNPLMLMYNFSHEPENVHSSALVLHCIKYLRDMGESMGMETLL